MHGNVPSVNSLTSAYMCLERPGSLSPPLSFSKIFSSQFLVLSVIFAELKKIEKRLGSEAFPVIPQTYFPHYFAIRIVPDFPNVAKVGYANRLVSLYPLPLPLPLSSSLFVFVVSHQTFLWYAVDMEK
jgi:hypothetical protein